MPARDDFAALVSIATVVAGIDQLSKAALVSFIGPMQPVSRVDIVGGWVALEYAENRGAAFGLFPGLAPVLVVVSIAVVAGLLVHYGGHARPSLSSTIGIGAIAGGAIGNLVDRLKRGYVIDFVSVGPWPNFNVADSAITLGVLILVWGWFQPRSDVGESKSG